MDEPLVSIIIPTYKSLPFIRDCLKSIRELNYKNFEIILVRDGGKEDLKAVCQEMGAKLIELEKNVGQGLARNKGVEQAKGTILAFVDSDCIVSPDWLKTAVNRLRHRDIGAVTGYYKDTALKNFLGYFQLYETLYRLKDIPLFVNNLASSNLVIKRKIFEDVGGFGPMRANEDTELGYWVSRRYRIYWDKDNGVTHYFRNSIYKYLKQQFFYAGAVIESVLHYPEMRSAIAGFGKTNTTLFDMFTCALTLFSLVLTMVSINFLPITLIFYALWLLIKYPILKFYYGKKNNIKFVFKAIMLYYLRDISWDLGLTRGVARGTFKRILKNWKHP